MHKAAVEILVGLEVWDGTSDVHVELWLGVGLEQKGDTVYLPCPIVMGIDVKS